MVSQEVVAYSATEIYAVYITDFIASYATTCGKMMLFIVFQQLNSICSAIIIIVDQQHL